MHLPISLSNNHSSALTLASTTLAIINCTSHHSYQSFTHCHPLMVMISFIPLFSCPLAYHFPPLFSVRSNRKFISSLTIHDRVSCNHIITSSMRIIMLVCTCICIIMMHIECYFFIIHHHYNITYHISYHPDHYHNHQSSSLIIIIIILVISIYWCVEHSSPVITRRYSPLSSSSIIIFYHISAYMFVLCIPFDGQSYIPYIYV